ncbi:MAG: chitobiase/beta-hexosaminidase C-terminal domain-containing protein [Verrucomicrobiales bacterium]|nr:chitobiase/beta-hexosaminidase C-terminal domain-containing protein [Verrucomicrobiales bacterium]
MRFFRPAFVLALLTSVLPWRCLGVVDYPGGVWEEDFATFQVLEPPHYGPGWYLYVGQGSTGEGPVYRAASLDASLSVTGGSLRTYARGHDHLMALVLRNTAERAIESFTLSYAGEQWTLTGAQPGDFLAVGYRVSSSFSAPEQISSRTPGTTVASEFIDMPALRFDAPRFGLTWMNIDGKLDGNRELLSATVNRINWQPGEYLILRWANFNQDGDAMTEQGLGIADIRFSGTLVSSVLTVGTTGQGTVERVPDKAFYAIGEPVELTAVPGRWHAFAQWTDGDLSNPRVVTVEGNATYTAAFEPTEPLETLELGGVTRLAPVGMPAVFVNNAFVPEGPVEHRGSVTVALQTTLPGGTLLYTLDGTDPAVSARLYDVPFEVSRNATVRAVAYDAAFSQAVQTDPIEVRVLPTLHAFTRGGGSVFVDPPAGSYGPEQSAVVTAVPDEGWEFLYWFGDVPMDQTETHQVVLTMTSSLCLEAVFGTGFSTGVIGSGEIHQSPAGDLYPYGTVVRLCAVPASGDAFARWGNAAAGTANPLEFVVDQPGQTVTAIFATLTDNRKSLVVLPLGAGSVLMEPAGNAFARGTRVTLTPVPAPGQVFTGWDDPTEAVSPLVITIGESRVIPAHFTQRPRLQFDDCRPIRSGGPLRLRIEGAPWETDVRLQSSVELQDWSLVDSAITRHGRAQISDWREFAPATRYYRLGP